MITQRIEDPQKIKVSLKELVLTTGDAVVYEGSYVAVPRVHQSTVLPTKDRLLKQDVQVLPVPIYEVSNDAGGNTLYIAEE